MQTAGPANQSMPYAEEYNRRAAWALRPHPPDELAENCVAYWQHPFWRPVGGQHHLFPAFIKGWIGECALYAYLYSVGGLYQQQRPSWDKCDQVDGQWWRPGMPSRLYTQVKTDIRTYETGNVFIELISDVERNAPGLVTTDGQIAKAEHVMYYMPQREQVGVITIWELNRRTDECWRFRPQIQVPNLRHTTVGVLVRVDEFLSRCRWVWTLPWSIARPYTQKAWCGHTPDPHAPWIW